MAINWTLPASSGKNNGDQNAADDPPIFPVIYKKINRISHENSLKFTR